MTSKILRSPSSALGHPMNSSLTMPRFAQRLTTAAAIRARFPAASSRLIDPHFLDRLQSPLTRYRD